MNDYLNMREKEMVQIQMKEKSQSQKGQGIGKEERGNQDFVFLNKMITIYVLIALHLIIVSLFVTTGRRDLFFGKINYFITGFL